MPYHLQELSNSSGTSVLHWREFSSSFSPFTYYAHLILQIPCKQVSDAITSRDRFWPTFRPSRCTLCVLAFRWTAPRRIALVAICLIWLFVILTIGITFGVHEGPVTYRGKVYTYYGDTKLWCWITQPFVEKQGIGLEYLWLWLAAFVDLLIYGFLALVVMNFVAVNENRRPRWVSNKERQMKNENSVVLSMDTRRSTAIRLSLWVLQV